VNVREYLDFFARAYQIRGRDRLIAVDRVMHFTGLRVLAEKPIAALSKGMRQRLCLGRALIHDPAVLVLDEPAAGLDPRARIELREMLRALAAGGKAILISSHILTELAEICDVVGILERGRLLAVGTVEDIQARGQTPESLVEVRVLGGAGPLAAWIAQRLGATAGLSGSAATRLGKPTVAPDGETLAFLYPGGAESEADLLRAMIEAGFRVAAFGSRRRSLEDVFMQITQGLVQ
jgi:ABC-2 type transport system ATP-binding protein